ncbi:MAG: DUF2520 domain-containing protein, partial [Saprospiraceae bacterium]|nr:DUF2520 domain-containing protein [Saprospiraceae bacterium]
GFGAEYSDTLEDLNTDLDICIIATSDNAIADVVEKMPVFVGEKVICHTSGSVPSTVFHRHFAHYGVIYPVQTFRASNSMDWDQVPLFITASNRKAENALVMVAKRLGGPIEKINDEQRQALHLAAVFVSNFSNAMYEVGARICTANDLSFQYLYPLIIQTADKVSSMDPAAAQTGPAIRRDHTTIKRHLKTLSQQGDLAKIYQLITNLIQKQSTDSI